MGRSAAAKAARLQKEGENFVAVNVSWPAHCYACGGEVTSGECFGCSFVDKNGHLFCQSMDEALDCDKWNGSSSDMANSIAGC